MEELSALEHRLIYGVAFDAGAGRLYRRAQDTES